MRIRKPARRDRDNEPEDISSLAITSLKDLRGEVHLVALPLETFRPQELEKAVRGRRCCRSSYQIWTRPQRGHSEVSNLEPSLSSDENIRRFQIKVDYSRVVDEVKTLVMRGHRQCRNRK